LVKSLDRVQFRYIYITDHGVNYSDEVLDVIPSEVEVEVEFTDSLGQRVMKKMINIPIGG